jgi:hypothetical protein
MWVGHHASRSAFRESARATLGANTNRVPVSVPSGEWTMSKLKARPRNWKPPVAAALLVRKRRPAWKSRTGFVRLRTVASWIRLVKA